MPPAVVALQLVRHPTTIPWLIIAIIVDPIERQSGRAFGHVLQERIEAIYPFITDLDASIFVVFLAPYAIAVCAAFHVLPRLIGARAPPAMHEPPFLQQTTAGL